MQFRCITCIITCNLSRYQSVWDTEGDSIMVHAIAKLCNLKLTVLNCSGHKILEQRFRHRDLLEHADVVVIYNGINHYCAAGIRSFNIDDIFVDFASNNLYIYILLFIFAVRKDKWVECGDLYKSAKMTQRDFEMTDDPMLDKPSREARDVSLSFEW